MEKETIFSSLSFPSKTDSMEKLSQTTLAHSFFLAETVGILFLNTILTWLTRFHKLSLSLYPEFLTCSTRESRLKNPSTEEREEDYLVVSREDIEIVMGCMGMAYSTQEGEQLQEVIGLDMFGEREPSLEEMETAFDVFDENSDGFIDAGELQRVLCKLGYGSEFALESCERMIQVHDENGDGRIDFDEFVKFMESSFC